MAKMAAMDINSKNLKKSSSSEPEDPGMTLTYFTSRST